MPSMANHRNNGPFFDSLNDQELAAISIFSLPIRVETNSETFYLIDGCPSRPMEVAIQPLFSFFIFSYHSLHVSEYLKMVCGGAPALR